MACRRISKTKEADPALEAAAAEAIAAAAGAEAGAAMICFA